MKRIIITLAIIFAALGLVSPARAAAPVISNVVKTNLGAGSYRYTVNIDQADSVTGYPQKSGVNPSATGGCKAEYKRKANGQQLFLGISCLTPGTVTYTTPFAPPCETDFTLTATTGSDVSVYTDQIGQTCPPPGPEAVTVTNDGTTITFTNPAAVAQHKTYGTTVPALSTTYSSADPFTYSTALRYAGVGPNTYVYAWATIGVDLVAGQTIVLVQNP